MGKTPGTLAYEGRFVDVSPLEPAVSPYAGQIVRRRDNDVARYKVLHVACYRTSERGRTRDGSAVVVFESLYPPSRRAYVMDQPEFERTFVRESGTVPLPATAAVDPFEGFPPSGLVCRRRC